LDFGQTQLRLANIFVIFLWIGAEKLLGGVFNFVVNGAQKLKGVVGKNNHFYNAKSEKQK
jgi:hypothetical protein